MSSSRRRVMRVGNAQGNDDRARARCAAYKAAHRGGDPPRAMRRGGASREARRPSIAPYRTGHEGCGEGGARRGQARGGEGKGAGCQAAHRADGAAARWGHRALPQRDTRGAHGVGAGERGVGEGRATGWGGKGGATCGAMGTSRPTAMPHEGRGQGSVGEGARRGGAGRGRQRGYLSESNSLALGSPS